MERFFDYFSTSKVERFPAQVKQFSTTGINIPSHIIFYEMLKNTEPLKLIPETAAITGETGAAGRSRIGATKC